MLSRPEPARDFARKTAFATTQAPGRRQILNASVSKRWEAEPGSARTMTFVPGVAAVNRRIIGGEIMEMARFKE